MTHRSFLVLFPLGCTLLACSGGDIEGRPPFASGDGLSSTATGDSSDTADTDATTTGESDDGDTGEGQPGDGEPGDGDTGDGEPEPGDGGDGLVGTPTDEGLRVAFIGDQGLGSDTEAVLDLVASEGAAYLVIAGDFDYDDNPAAWDAMITDRLGADYPVLAVAGNHDKDAFGGDDGYQAKIIERLNNATNDGASCDGEPGLNSSCTYKGLFLAMSDVDVFSGEAESADYLRSKLAGNDAIWSVCVWHKNQHDMQVGDKSDEAGWGVYEACQDEAGIIITGHEHSYSRTFSLDDVGNAAAGHGAYGDPGLMQVSEGSTYVSVVGIGGRGLRNFEPSHANDTWWASYFTSNACLNNGAPVADCDADSGALFIDFYVDGDPYKARAYVKTIDGIIMDEYEIVRDPTMTGDPDPDPDPDPADLIIDAFDDAHVDGAAPDSNFGSSVNLTIDASPSAIEIFIRPLGVDAIPANTVIERAVLRLQSHNAGDDAEARQVSSAWAEDTITYNDKPGSAAPVSNFSTAVGVVEIDVTSIVQSWVAGAPVHGVHLRSDGGNGSDFHSSESAFSRPELHVWTAP